MPAHVAILCGPARSGKTERALGRYRDIQTQQPLGGVLWLAPTWRAAAAVRDRLFENAFAGCFRPGIHTFHKYAEVVLRTAKHPIREIDRLTKRELVRQLVAGQLANGRLRYFRSIAGTSGLVDLICEFIGELKRLEIWPEEFHKACASRGIGDKDVELWEVYDLYQRTLRDRELYDAEGLFWSARDVLKRIVNRDPAEGGEEDPRLGDAVSPQNFSPIFRPRLVVADGFADFTRTQHEILEILGKHATELLITLPFEAEPERRDMFSKPAKTLAEIRRRHSNVVIEELHRPTPSVWPSMAHLEQGIFQNPRRRSGQNAGDAGDSRDSPAKAAGIEILAAAKPLGEIRMIAERIKQLLVNGPANPGDIVVAFRSLPDAGELVQEVFGQVGIPFLMESGSTLDRTPVVRALLALLQLDIEDWPFEPLLAVLGSNYFEPENAQWSLPKAAGAARAIRSLQIPQGRERLLAELARRAHSSAEGQKTTAVREETTALAAALSALECLDKAFEALPANATLPEWIAAWERLAQATGLWKAMETEPGDRQAWNCLMEGLDSAASGVALGAGLGRERSELPRREAVEMLWDVARNDRIEHGGDEAGHVRVLSAPSLRSLSSPYLFLAGLSEKAFPAPDREDRLYSEGETLRLVGTGLPLVTRTERTREEMLLFYEAVTRATKRLYLSYPALDDAAQSLLPSPFLTEVEQVFGEKGVTRSEQKDLSPVPAGEPLCTADFRIQAMATALDGNAALLAELMRGEMANEGEHARYRDPTTPSLAENLAAGLELTYLRQSREQFGPAEGILPSEAVRSFLAARYPAHHTFAATELESYASCPFRFLLERLLKLEPVEDLALEFDVRNRGRVVHDVLASFHRRVNARLGRPGSPLELALEEADSLLASAIEESLPSEAANTVQAALREIDRRLVLEWMAGYREQCAKYDEQWKAFETPMKPELFEISFGRGDVPPPSADIPLELTHADQTIRLSGRVDRIDGGMVAGHAVFNVLDYKTGGTIKLTAESIRAGLTLQLPLYVFAVMELILDSRDSIPWQAGYWYVREGGFKPRQALRMYRNVEGRIELEPEWESIRAGLAKTVLGLAANLRAGRFPVCSVDERCTGVCPFHTVCRIHQIRSLGKASLSTAREQMP